MEVFRGTGAGAGVEWKIFGVKKAIRNLEALGESVGELMKPEVTAAGEMVLREIKKATPVGKKKKKGQRLREKNKLYATRVTKNMVSAQIKNQAIYARVVEWGWDGKGRNSFMRSTVKRLNDKTQNEIRHGAIRRIERKAAKLGMK